MVGVRVQLKTFQLHDYHCCPQCEDNDVRSFVVVVVVVEKNVLRLS